ncbi:hypothetical protein S40293_07129 [Stachybotrys chartarum IBT 40293]|nr:hypothetical protein S40293_07129 [Stachybotrys chartarum IBT 40293]
MPRHPLTPGGDEGGSGSGTPGAGAGAKTRRTHRKSRNGCSECKRRHIRCDEGRPSCTNCTIAERVCSFPLSSSAHPAVVSASSSSPQSIPQQPLPAIPSRSPVPPSASPGYQPPPPMASASSSASLGPLLHHQPPQSPQPPPLPPHSQNHVHLPSYHHLVPPPQQPLSPALSVGDSNEPVTAIPEHHRHSHHHYQHHPQMSPIDARSATDSRPGLSPHASHVLPPPHPPPLTSTTSIASSSSSASAATFTAQHLNLLHHAENNMDDSFLGRGQARLTISVALKNATSAPYLIDEVLALAAVHLIITGQAQESSASLQRQATELQTRALATFTRETGAFGSTSSDEVTNAVPRFLFSALLSMHVLANCLAHDPSSAFHNFIDSFVECIRLHTGVRTVIKPDWYTILKSELYPMLSAANVVSAQNLEKKTGNECEPLDALMQTADLSPSSAAACRSAVKALQWAFDWQNNYQDRHTAYAGSAFVIVVTDDFAEVLRKHRPEALVIMAYYGVLLHRARRFWVFGSSGAQIVRAVAHNLGSFWQDAIKWPLHVIATEVD